uniref:Uncharacterized protein n=1 Tax=Anguilla anguilla TaxID=7936 RepID=A0A0E9QIC4_ANGAN
MSKCVCVCRRECVPASHYSLSDAPGCPNPLCVKSFETSFPYEKSYTNKC